MLRVTAFEQLSILLPSQDNTPNITNVAVRLEHKIDSPGLDNICFLKRLAVGNHLEWVGGLPPSQLSSMS